MYKYLNKQNRIVNKNHIHIEGIAKNSSACSVILEVYDYVFRLEYSLEDNFITFDIYTRQERRLYYCYEDIKNNK